MIKGLSRRKTSFILLCVIGLLTIGTFILYVDHMEGGAIEPNQDYSGEDKDWQSRLNESTKIILIYTELFGKRVWHGLTGSKLTHHFEECTGKYNNCLATYNRARLNRADAVIFHGRDIEVQRKGYYNAERLKRLRKKLPKGQKWIYLSHENPQDDVNIYKPYDGVFNWTSTFSRRSDIFLPYSSYVKLEKPRLEQKNHAEGKTGTVAWAVSHCNIMRQEYVLELERYIDVTVYGRCRTRFQKQRDCHHHDPACKRELSTYKFFLAFENAFCQDYVTEKYWERLVSGDVVPVVMGANYDKGIVIPESYIDASDFKSIKDLADYLMYLDSNDTAYNKYFEYKKMYGLGTGSMLCTICERLHSEDFKKLTQVKLSKVHSLKETCWIYNYKEDRFWKQISESQKKNGLIIRGKIRLFLKKLLGRIFLN